MAKPSVSIVICTFNRAAFLKALIESIAREWTDRLDAELIVVDNNCTDDTPAVVASFKGRTPEPRHIVETKQGLSHARNSGADAATKDYILYLDDDAKLTDAYLERLEIVLRRFQPDLFGGPVLPMFDRPLPPWFNPQSEVRQFEPISGFTKTGSVSGGNFGIRRDLVARLGGFNTALGMTGDTQAFGEDREMVERYRQRTPAKDQKIYYAVELPILHYTMPYKLDLNYQYQRKLKNAEAQEITFVRTGKRSRGLSLLLALGHFLYFPVFALRLGVSLRFNVEWRFQTVRHLYGIVGRLRGSLKALFMESDKKAAAPAQPWRAAEPSD